MFFCFVLGDIVKLDTRPVAFGKTRYFIKKGKATEVGSIIYCQLPEEVYGDGMEERPVMRIAGKPDEAALRKVFASERLHLPSASKLYFFVLFVCFVCLFCFSYISSLI